jgi:hypothetical protein
MLPRFFQFDEGLKDGVCTAIGRLAEALLSIAVLDRDAAMCDV